MLLLWFIFPFRHSDVLGQLCVTWRDVWETFRECHLSDRKATPISGKIVSGENVLECWRKKKQAFREIREFFCKISACCPNKGDWHFCSVKRNDSWGRQKEGCIAYVSLPWAEAELSLSPVPVIPAIQVSLSLFVCPKSSLYSKKDRNRRANKLVVVVHNSIFVKSPMVPVPDTYVGKRLSTSFPLLGMWMLSPLFARVLLCGWIQWSQNLVGISQQQTERRMFVINQNNQVRLLFPFVSRPKTIYFENINLSRSWARWLLSFCCRSPPKLAQALFEKSFLHCLWKRRKVLLEQTVVQTW